MIEAVVGKKVYSVWLDMIHRMVPSGRTHRLSVVLASMLQYTQEIAYEKSNGNAKARNLSNIFDESHENYAEGDTSELLKLAESILKDAKVKYKRTSTRGHGYSIAEEAVNHYLHWDDLPWES
ncbi:hypothetical protein AB833_09445 [Chromatiales bacterium (ex Bugula neritina AB1)]|nr:hypothetical protein AB833_09445 [Chromatiales bacterium (ex Bugula neritina AB1)]